MLLPDIGFSTGTLLRIGAGKSFDTSVQLDGDARVILVEAHPDLAKALASQTAKMPQVTVLAVAAGPEGAAGDGVLHLFSDLRHASLHKPTATLADLLPGLRATGDLVVPIVPAGQLLDGMGELRRPLHVEIDAPGSEMEILAAFLSNGTLDQIDSLDVRVGVEPLYVGAVAAQDVQNWLEEAGFQVAAQDVSDPDWPEMRFVIDQKTRAMEREIQALAGALEAAEARLATQRQKAEAAREAHAGVLRPLRQELRQLQEVADARAQRIAELEQAQEQTVHWGREQETLARQRVEWIGGLEAELANQRAQADETRGRLEWRIGELEADLTGTKAWAERNDATMRERDAQIAQLMAELAESQGRAEAQLKEAESLKQAQAAALQRADEQEQLARDRRAKIQRLEADAQQHQQTTAEERALLEEQLAEMGKRVETLDEKRAAGEAKVKELAGLAAARAAKMAEVEQALVDARQALAAKSTDMTKAAAIAEAKVKELTDLAATRVAKLAEVEKALAETRQAVEVKSTALAEATEVAGQAKAAALAKVKELTDLAAARVAKLAEVEKALAETRQAVEMKSKALAEAAEVAGQAKAAAQAKVKELTDLAATRAEKLAEVEKALAESRQAVAVKSKALAEATEVVGQANQAKAAAQARIKELGDLSAARIAKLAGLEKSLAEATEDAGQANQAKVAAEAKVKELTELAAARAAKLVEVEKTHSQAAQGFQTEMARARQDLAIAVRMHAVVANDMRVLQGRLADISAIKDAQEDLLRKLTPRLQEASAQLRSLMEIPVKADKTKAVGATKAKKPGKKKASTTSGLLK